MVGLCGLDTVKVNPMPDLHTLGYLIIGVIYIVLAFVK